MVNDRLLSFKEVVNLTAEEPAKIFSLNKRGSLVEGNYADLVVVDIRRKHVIDSSLFFSKAKYSPFDGLSIKGKAIKTFVNGTLVMDDGNIISENRIGKVIKPKRSHATI
jgi:dihydroorotase